MSIGVVLLIAFSMMNCSGSKNTTVREQEPGTQVIIIPLSGNEYKSDKEYFRATASGKSPDIELAQKIAMANVESKIAGQIKKKVGDVVQNYVNQRSTENAIEFEKKFEGLTTTTVNQQLVDISVKGEKLLKTGNIYEYWVGIEISKQAVLNGLVSNISNDKKLQIDYDKMKFEEVYNKEMEKLEKGQ